MRDCLSMRAELVILDDHPLVRDSIASCIDRALPDVRLVYSGASIRAALESLRSGDATSIDRDQCLPVAILDLDLGDDRSPAASAADLTDAGAAVIMVSAHDQPSLVQDAIVAGARAYVAKRSMADLLPRAVTDVRLGLPFRSMDFAAVLVPTATSPLQLEPPVERVLVLHAAGLPMTAIASRLDLPVPDCEALLERAWEAYGL